MSENAGKLGAFLNKRSRNSNRTVTQNNLYKLCEYGKMIEAA